MGYIVGSAAKLLHFIGFGNFDTECFLRTPRARLADMAEIGKFFPFFTNGGRFCLGKTSPQTKWNPSDGVRN